jgi:hypothetical protein
MAARRSIAVERREARKAESRLEWWLLLGNRTDGNGMEGD